MAQSDFDRLMSISGFGTPDQINTARQESAARINAKRASVQEMSKMKQILLGNEQTQRAIVTADQMGNELAQDAQVQDALNMDPFEFVIKYGPNASIARQRIRDAYSELNKDKNIERSTGQAIGDSVLDGLSGVAGLVGTVPTLGTMVYDSLQEGFEKAVDTVLPDNWYNYEPMAPAVSNIVDTVVKKIGEQRSETGQIKAEQYGLQQSLDAQDREAAYERGDVNWFQKQGAGVTDTLSNMANVPEMITSTAANAAGSLIPFAAAAQATAKATVLYRLSKEGITGVQAQAYLRTAAGQRAVQEASIQAVPALGATVGSGSAANQAQVAILSMSDETLQTMPDYAELSAQGLDNDAIRNRLASQAGNVAALPGAVIGYVAGFLNRGFDAAPLRTGGTTMLSRTTRGVTNIPREAAQEFVEEGGANQLSANIGVASVDPSQRLDEGVAEAGTMGAVGGGLTATATQVPGLALETLAATGRTLLSGVNIASNARANRADNKSKTGINATTAAIGNISNVVNQIAELEIEETDTVRKGIVQEIVNSITVEKENKYFADYVAAIDNAKISNVTPRIATKIISAVSGLLNIKSDTLAQKIDALDEADPIRRIYANISDDMKTVESATIFEKSKEVLEALSSDEIKQLVKIDKLSDKETSQEDKQTILQTAALMARINPNAFNGEEWNIVLNQMSPEDAGKISQNDRAAVTTARDNAQISAQTEVKKSNNENRLQKIFKKLPTVKKEAEQTLRERLKKTVAEVKIDIRGKIHNSEKTGKSSLSQYVANTNQLMSEGKVNAAQDLLTNLYEFAKGQANKIEALNKAAKDGATGAKYGFQTWDGSKRTDPNDPKGLKVFVNAKSPASLLFALDVDADTREVIDTYNALRNAYPELSGLPEIEAPLLSSKIGELLDNIKKPTKEATEETTSKTEEAFDAQETQASEEPTTPEVSEELILISPSNAVEMRAAKKAFKELKKQYRELKKEWRKIWNTDSKAKKPLIAKLISKGLKIDPNGTVGKELYASGVTSKVAPGLFKKGGLSGLDNLVQEEWEQELPGITEATDSEISDYEYLNQDGLISLIAEEVAGNTNWLYSRQQVNELDEAIDYLEREIEGVENEIELLEIEQKTGQTPNEQRNAQNNKAERTVGTDDRTAKDRIRSVSESKKPADSTEKSQAADTSPQEAPETEPKLNVWAGTDENAEFSNLSPRAFKDSTGREYFSVEHAYQSLKSGEFDESTYEKYSKGQSRKIAGRKGTKTENNYNIRLMETLIFESFRQNPKAAQKLIDTGEAVFTHTQDKGVWKKAFPKALMKAREKLKTVESPAPAKEIKRTPLKDALTNLFGGVANKIASVFKRQEKGSDLLDMENIAEEMTRRFAENNKSEEANKAFAIIMERVLPGLEKYIADYIRLDEKRAASFLKNPDLKDKPNLRILELFDQDTLKLNEKVSIAIAMAASEWISELTYDAYKTERRKLNSLFAGRKPYDPITEVVERAGDFGGITHQAALQSLSKKIQNILGVQENKAADPEDAQGIFGSLATTVFAALQEKGLIETATFSTEKELDKKGKERYAQQRFAVRPNIRNEQTKALRKFMRELNMPFSTALSIESNRFYIGAPKEFVKNQTRWNKFSFLTKLMEKALSANQNIAHKLNTPLITVLDVLDTDTLANLLGQVTIDETKMHPDDVRSQRGKNQTIITSLESLATWRKLIEHYAAENDMEIEDVPVHFEAAVGSNGRINQVAPINVPQSDKLLRELLVPSRTVVDMSDETSMTSFWAGISQALGGKIEKLPSFDDVKTDAQERLSERQEAISYLKKVLLDGALSEADGKKFKAQLKKFDFDMKILHALLAEAARQNAVDQNSKEFTTHLTIEADGVTDGPINSVINLLTPSKITPQLLEIMASGGLIFGNDPATLDDYYNRGSVDLYAMIAEKLGERLNNSFKDNPRLAALMNIADGFLDGLDREKGSLIIDRELVKNPITVFLYNSSPSGIADKITELTVKNFAALMTKIAQKKGELTESDVYKENETALKAFMVSSDPKYANKRITDKQVNDFYRNPLTAQINKEKLKKDYLDIFVEPLLEAINDTLPGLKENMTFLNDIAKKQTELFQIVFKENADALQQKLGRSLSQDDLEIVLKQSLKVAPIFYTTTMGLEVSELKPATTKKSIAQDFREKFQFFETTKEPADAKFKMVPNFVQSTGDGGMIANAYANDKNNLMDKSIQVFDGIEMSIDTFSDGSEHINQQVFNNWLSTKIYEEVQRSIDQVVSIKDLSAEAQELQAELKKFITPRDSKKSPLDEKIDSSKRLKKIVQDFPSSTDHMAGAKRAYVNEGRESLAGMEAFDFEAMARAMDKLFQKSLPAKPIDGVAKPSKAFMDAVKKVGSVVKGYKNVIQIKGSALTQILNSKEFTADQKLVFAQIMKKDKIFNDYTFYFGEPDDLEAIRDTMYADSDLPKFPISLGQTFTAEPIALIANMSPETLLHEMLHASLALRIMSIKKEPEKFTVQIRKALQNLEKLQARFLGMDITSIPDLEQDEREAFTAMQTQINNAKTDVEKLSEFLSWSMSNKALIDKAKRTKVHKPLVQMVLKILQTTKEFLGFVKRPGVDMFSNIVYNTAWITRTYTPLKATPNKVFEQRYGPNTHIEQVEGIFLERLNHFIEAAAEELEPAVTKKEKETREANLEKGKADRKEKTEALKLNATEIAEKLNHSFFRLDQRQASTFVAIHASLKTGFKIDSSAMQEATQLYNQVIDKLTAKDFVADWARSSQAEKDQAQAKLDALIEESPITMIALAQVDESFSNALSKLTSDPDTPLNDGSQIDRVIRNIATGVANNLSRLLTTTRDNSQPVNQQLAALTVAMAEIQKDRRFAAESFVMNAQMKANTWAADKIYNASGAASTKLEKIAKQYDGQSKIISNLAMRAAFVTGLANKDRSKQMFDKLQSELNKARSFDWFQALVADLRSDQPDMIRLGKALNKIRREADRVRQHQKDLRIKYMNAAFDKRLTEQDNKDLFMGLGRTDISTLGRENVLGLLKNPETTAQRIKDAKKELRQLAPQHYNAYLDKINSLANFMLTWKSDTPNLLRNAHAIGNLLNEKNRPTGPVDKRVLVLISQLTSLEAFNKLPSATKANLKNLIATETNGMEIVVGNLAEVHSNEFNRRIKGREGEISLKNGWKGYLPMNFAQGQEVIIADDRDQAKLEQEGWVRIRSYSGDPRETNPTSRGLYQTTVGGKGQFRQGILQTVHKQWHGVDPRNGVTNSSQATSGFLTGAAATRVSQSNVQARTGQNVDYMLPVFDENDQVMGYEYSIPMRDLEGAAPEMDLIESLGSWFGRIEEEEVSGQLNKAAVLQHKKLYDAEYSESNANEWINVADPDIEDAVYKDAWSVLGYETKSSAAEAFGAPNFFPIKRVEIDSMIGYRLANPKDLWTGVSRINDDNRKIMRDIISLPFGNNTYTYINKSYGVVTSATSWAKVNILIRSGVVPIGNYISNMVHLKTWGLGLVSQLARTPKKLKEISRVVRIQEEIGKLSTELPSIINNQAKVKRIEAKIKALEAEQEAMSIWPVLQADEFSTISESLTRADLALRQGSMFDYLEKQADKLPPLVGDITKTAILAKDTELFKMMHHFMQYGDFIAKSMLYDHLLENQQKTPEQALDIISVEYVNYNRPSGRWRDALEQTGMLWFSNYALRIMPIMLNLIRDRPVSALLYGAGIAPAMDIDTVISGSAAGKIGRGALGYSFGPGMGFRSIQLNPIINSVF